jgi:hypothetical protein
MKTRFVKAKSKAIAMVADGKGGMVKVQDRRFEQEWAIRFEVPQQQAATWLRYFHAECFRRGWNSNCSGQISARENGTSITVNADGSAQKQLAVIMEQKHGDVLKIRARSIGAIEFPLADCNEFFEQINKQCHAGITELIYGRAQLAYEGLPLRGELWLDDTLRLYPPSQQYEFCLNGPRVIMVDAQVDCIGQIEAGSVFNLKLRELSLFLSVVMGKAVYLPENRQVWTYVTGASDCNVRSLGYWESELPAQMPAKGTCRPALLKAVNRPDFSFRGNDGSVNEHTFPDDIIELWGKYRALSPEARQKFLQVAAKWQEAFWFHSIRRRTLSYTLMIVACESLKPSAPEFSEHNIYHVVEALLGKNIAERLQRESFDPFIHPATRPQSIRSEHLHTGKCYDSEFELELPMLSYRDPTFGQAYSELWLVVQECIIEWLRRGGNFALPPVNQKKNTEHWMKHIITDPWIRITLLLGVIIGWLLHQL